MSQDVHRVEWLIDLHPKYSETAFLLSRGLVDSNSLTEQSSWDFHVPRWAQTPNQNPL